mgnify:CR=1 FL=1
MPLVRLQFFGHPLGAPCSFRPMGDDRTSSLMAINDPPPCFG